MTPETWRWLIGGGLLALTGGMAWLMRAVWGAAQTLARIESRLGFHGDLHAKHTDTLDAHDGRLRRVEASVARHTGRMESAK